MSSIHSNGLEIPGFSIFERREFHLFFFSFAHAGPRSLRPERSESQDFLCSSRTGNLTRPFPVFCRRSLKSQSLENSVDECLFSLLHYCSDLLLATKFVNRQQNSETSWNRQSKWRISSCRKLSSKRFRNELVERRVQESLDRHKICSLEDTSLLDQGAPNWRRSVRGCIDAHLKAHDETYKIICTWTLQLLDSNKINNVANVCFVNPCKSKNGEYRERNRKSQKEQITPREGGFLSLGCS